VLFRDRVQNLIAEYKVSAAAVRLSETYLKHKPKPNVLASMFARARIEGVVLEAARASGIPVHASQLVSISARLGSKSAKAYVTGGEFRGVDLSSKQPNRREAIVAAVSALKE
jgi:hypothetical protein